MDQKSILERAQKLVLVGSIQTTKTLAIESKAPQLKDAAPLFQIGDLVYYQTPVIKTSTDYIWEWHHGTVLEVNDDMQIAFIMPGDGYQEWIGIPFVYIRPYEKNEINEVMEATDEEETESHLLPNSHT